ncbi:hypothetical protein PHMEG_00014027 [Phytophthora megakarya]|uniref:Uncharacterized protein n=1 Tax=Phytophthora megakarya TaxID=4795 RepID=A0A225W5B8_9STRA|nr:hypothetical protein PHMEG_00014027 [Phytophthora megakarya]
MLFGYSDGCKNDPFIVFKNNPEKSIETQAINNSTRNGFGETVWKKYNHCKVFIAVRSTEIAQHGEVVGYANIINVVLLKVPPRYTYVCQPADVSWNQPLKSRLRERWIHVLKQQLSSFKSQDSSRQQKRKALTTKIAKVHKEHTQKDAPSKQPSITQWITEWWYELSGATITSGLRKVGLLMGTRVIEDDFVNAGDIDPTVDE